MSATKVAISMDETLLQRLDRLVKTRSFRSRSQAVQEAVSQKISRMDKRGLARECAKLDRKSEQAMADEGLPTEISAWPDDCEATINGPTRIPPRDTSRPVNAHDRHTA